MREAGIWPGAFRRGDARLIVIAKRPVRPGVSRESAFVVIDTLHDGISLKWTLHQARIERQMTFIEALAVIRHQLRIWQRNFPEQYALVILVQHGAHFFDQMMHFGLIGRSIMPRGFEDRAGGRPVGIRRVVAQLRVFDQQPDRIHAKAIHAAIQPEAHRVQHVHHDIRMMPVQIRLFFGKLMQVILPRLFIPFPG